ncbi:15808_t:CDS:2 [Funneliformis geosporum]|uniref:15808_t:CDS:1 n=1 Tax=Funneliformis geosporum TaxID=1117311 RepID=A0A9W4SEW7_9GLOM|nr:15808_t:CDS:2 [Funneliformis geosporum]
MSDNKDSLDYLSIYSFLFLNKKGSNLYNAYNRDKVDNKLDIKLIKIVIVPQTVIDIDVSQGDIETTDIKTQEVFI